MAELTIRDTLWHDFVALAQKQRRRPQALAESVLRDYIQRIADEELLADSRCDARRAKICMEDVVELIRQYRRKKSRKTLDGRAKKAGAGGS